MNLVKRERFVQDAISTTILIIIKGMGIGRKKNYRAVDNKFIFYSLTNMSSIFTIQVHIQ